MAPRTERRRVRGWQRTSRGVGLVDLLVATGMGVIVLFFAYSGLARMRRASDVVAAKSQYTAMTNIFRDRLARELSLRDLLDPTLNALFPLGVRLCYVSNVTTGQCTMPCAAGPCPRLHVVRHEATGAAYLHRLTIFETACVANATAQGYRTSDSIPVTACQQTVLSTPPYVCPGGQHPVLRASIYGTSNAGYTGWTLVSTLQIPDSHDRTRADIVGASMCFTPAAGNIPGDIGSVVVPISAGRFSPDDMSQSTRVAKVLTSDTVLTLNPTLSGVAVIE